jgi:hypothetical protein
MWWYGRAASSVRAASGTVVVIILLCGIVYRTVQSANCWPVRRSRSALPESLQPRRWEQCRWESGCGTPRGVFRNQ